MLTVWSDCHLKPISLILRRYLRETMVNGRVGQSVVPLKSIRPKTVWDVGTQLQYNDIWRSSDRSFIYVLMLTSHPMDTCVCNYATCERLLPSLLECILCFVTGKIFVFFSSPRPPFERTILRFEVRGTGGIVTLLCLELYGALYHSWRYRICSKVTVLKAIICH
jgi:hypothetical protein